MYKGKKASGTSGHENALPPQMAIKVVKVEDKHLRNKLQEECELLRKFSHKNIISYYGCYTDKEKNEASIFMELMPHSL